MKKILFLFLFIGFHADAQIKSILQQGDIVFQDLNCGPLCDAIESVTYGVDGRDFSHCGMVINEDSEWFVIEAIGPGVIKTDLNHFLQRSGDTAEIKNIVIGRLKELYQPLIEGATAYAFTKLGVKYDDVFGLDNDAFYCSELIYEAYKSANNDKPIFSLNTMTFKNPITKAFDPAWVDYFNQLGKRIPEGDLGLNPGSLSRSEAIEIVKF